MAPFSACNVPLVGMGLMPSLLLVVLLCSSVFCGLVDFPFRFIQLMLASKQHNNFIGFHNVTLSTLPETWVRLDPMSAISYSAVILPCRGDEATKSIKTSVLRYRP